MRAGPRVSRFASRWPAPGRFGVPAQTGDLKPGDNLVIEGVPPIPLTLVDAVGRYTDFRAATFQSWHPTRREMLISTRFGNVTQAHLVKFPGGARTQMTFYPGPRLRRALRSEDRRLLHLLEGRRRRRVLPVSIATTSPTDASTLLTDGKSRNTDAALVERGRRHRVRFDAPQRERRRPVRRQSTGSEDRPPRRSSCPDGGWQVADWSPDDTDPARHRRDLHQRDLPLADRRRERSEDSPDAQRERSTSRTATRRSPATARALYVTTDRGSEFQRLAIMDLATKKLDFLTADMADVDDVRPLPRRPMARLRHQREGRERPPCARHRDPPRTARAEAAARRRHGPALAPRRRSDRPDDGDRSLERRRLVVGREVAASSSAGPRASSGG